MQIVEPNKSGSNSIIDSKKNDDTSDEDDDEDEDSLDDEVLLYVIMQATYIYMIFSLLKYPFSLH